MESTYDSSQPRSSWDEELQNLESVLKPGPVTHRLLSDWATESGGRAEWLAGGVWGGIHWAKGLGRPRTPSITDGFSIVHEAKTQDWVDDGGHYTDRGKWQHVKPGPSVWDATVPESNEYRVGFFFFAR